MEGIRLLAILGHGLACSLEELSASHAPASETTCVPQAHADVGSRSRHGRALSDAKEILIEGC